MSDDVPRDYLSRIGKKGGAARTDSKRQATKLNCAKARAAKAIYRMRPEMRPQQGENDASQ